MLFFLGLASLTKSHHLQPRQFTGLADHSGQWNYPGFPASVTPTIPRIKYETPVQQIRTSFRQPSIPTSAMNSYAFSGVPVSAQAFGRRRMMPSASRGKDFRFYKASSAFLETDLSSSLTSSSSALEMLVSSSSNALSGSTSANLVNSSFNHAASSYINSQSRPVFENGMQLQCNAASSAVNPDFMTHDLDVAGLTSNLPDDAAFREDFNDDIFRMLVTSDDQRNAFGGVGTDFPVLTDEDFNSFSELFQ